MNRNRQLLAAVYSKTDGHCWYCGAHLPPFSNWEIEHQDPISKGGTNDLWNLVPACRPCNSRKSGRDLGEYEEYLIGQAIALINTARDFMRFLEGPEIGDVRESLLLAHDLLSDAGLVFWGDGHLPDDEKQAAAEARAESVISDVTQELPIQ